MREVAHVSLGGYDAHAKLLFMHSVVNHVIPLKRVHNSDSVKYTVLIIA
jgi:hypothetical protein